MEQRANTGQTLARYRKFGWEYHQTQGIGSQYGDLEWFLQIAAKYGGPILDLGCGSGRLLPPLRREGFSVVGLDGSRQMLALCHTHGEADASPGEPPVALVQAEFGGLCFSPHSFGMVIIAGNTLPAIEESVRRQLFSEISTILCPGGVLAVAIRRNNLGRFENDIPVVHHHDPLYDEARACWVIRRTELTYLKGTNQIIARFRFRCLFPSGTAEESQYEMAYTADYADRIAQEAHASGLVLESTCAGYGQSNCSGPAAEMLGIVLRSQPGG